MCCNAYVESENSKISQVIRSKYPGNAIGVQQKVLVMGLFSNSNRQKPGSHYAKVMSVSITFRDSKFNTIEGNHSRPQPPLFPASLFIILSTILFQWADSKSISMRTWFRGTIISITSDLFHPWFCSAKRWSGIISQSTLKSIRVLSSPRQSSVSQRIRRAKNLRSSFDHWWRFKSGILEWIETQAEKCKPITCTDIRNYCEEKYSHSVGRRLIDSFISRHCDNLTEVKSICQEDPRLEVPHIFRNEMIRWLRKYV
jgi:hypothetical protein